MDRIIMQLPGMPPFPAICATHWEYQVGMRVVAMDYAPFSRRRWRLGTVTFVSEYSHEPLLRRGAPVIEVKCDDGEVLRIGASWLHLLNGTEPLQLAGGLSVYEKALPHG